MRDFKKRKCFKSFLKKGAKIGLFWLILLVLVTGMSLYLTKAAQKDINMIRSRNKNITLLSREPENTIDILVLGDSLGYSSFSPMQWWEDYGYTAFVGCQSGQVIQESYTMLRTAFQTQKPKLVILETNVIFRDQTGLNGIKNFLAEVGNYYFPILRFHDLWKTALTGKIYPEENFKGFTMREKVQPYEGGTYMKENKNKQKISDMVSDYMDNIIELCKENDTQLVLVSTPSPVNYNYQKYNTLKDYAKDHGLAYVDMNRDTAAVGIDWSTDSLDKGDHLNLSGARKVTAYMGKYLKENYSLEDHRGKKGYGSWDESAKSYNYALKMRTGKSGFVFTGSK